MGTLAASLVFAQGGFDGPGRYEIRNVQTGKVMDVGRREQLTVVQESPGNTDNQFWDIQPAPGGFFILRNAINGRVLQLFRNTNKSQMVVAPPDEGNRGQLWRIQPARDGNVMIVSSFGWAIDVPGGSGNEGQRLQVYDQNGEGNQSFVLRRVGGGEPRRDIDRDGGGGRRDQPERNRDPDRFGRFWDDREQSWKVAGDGACFYQQTGFRGDALCTRVGSDIGDAVRQFNGTFGSVRLFGHASAVEVFETPGFRGDRFRITHDEPDLKRARGTGDFSFGVGSFRVN